MSPIHPINMKSIGQKLMKLEQNEIAEFFFPLIVVSLYFGIEYYLINLMIFKVCMFERLEPYLTFEHLCRRLMTHRKNFPTI